jgi:hypothetical protein
MPETRFFCTRDNCVNVRKTPLVLRTVYKRPRKFLKPPKALVARLLQYDL